MLSPNLWTISWEDKYVGQKAEKSDKMGICASSKGVGKSFFAGVVEVKFLIC